MWHHLQEVALHADMYTWGISMSMRGRKVAISIIGNLVKNKANVDLRDVSREYESLCEYYVSLKSLGHILREFGFKSAERHSYIYCLGIEGRRELYRGENDGIFRR